MEKYILVCVCRKCRYEWITRKTHTPRICPKWGCGTKFWREGSRTIYAPDVEPGATVLIPWPYARDMLIDAIKIYSGRKGLKFKSTYTDAGLEITRIY